MKKIMIGKFFGKIFILVILYLLICAIIYFFSYFSLLNKKFINLPAFKVVQKNLYWNKKFGFVDVWQNKPECTTYDDELIYVPKIGICNFKNAEFDTILSFTQNGRFMPEISNSTTKPIIVIGDSHAMGWGVNDDETFSYILQKNLKNKVYNLAVSSYGTIREVKRLERGNLLKNSDIIILQYHENDIRENRNFHKISKNQYSSKFAELNNRQTISILEKTNFILKSYKSSLRLIFSDITGFFVKIKNELDFEPHYPILIKTIKSIENFEKKKIIIFFSNGPESRFYNFPEGFDTNYQNIYFADIKLEKEDHFFLDKHPNKLGHDKIAKVLNTILNSIFKY